MARQRGSVKEIIKGKKYKISFYIGTDGNGKRKYYIETIECKNKAEAQKYLAKKIVEYDTGTLPIDETNITVKDYLKKWLETKKSSLALKTYNDYEQKIRLYIDPAIGNYKLLKLTPLIIQNMYNNMLEQGLSARTIRYTHTVLNEALKQAIKWQMLRYNPCDGTTLPKQAKKEMKVLTPEQAKKFLEACVYNRWGILFELLLISGMRPSEALGLKWEDIDWKNNRIAVQRTLTRVKNNWQLKEPKTPQSRRTIPLPREVMNDLKEHRKQQSEEKLKAKEYINYDKDKNKFKPEKWEEKLKDPKVYVDYGLVFATETGRPLDLANINYQYFKPLLKNAGLPNIRLYDLRHTCATLLLLAGENPKVVSERLGHANITLTLDTYSHVLPTMQEEATQKLKQMLFGS
ncbi:MAG: tyrosine-type recombinase/integrase [Thermoanaerobacter sp.]|nr:tyrosine-type recombinase/integrase [Thermoanaerobacter sp.]